MIYTGSQTDIQRNNQLEVSGSIVMTLMQLYLQRAHNVFIDNWYTSPIFVDLVHANSTGVCGTVRRNQIGLPNYMKKLKRSEHDYQHTDVLLAVRWFDKREATMLSTIHEPKMVNSEKID
jgi:hypothetical protein